MQGVGQLPAFTGEMVSVTVGGFANEAVIAQETQMAADVDREFYVAEDVGYLSNAAALQRREKAIKI